MAKAKVRKLSKEHLAKLKAGRELRAANKNKLPSGMINTNGAPNRVIMDAETAAPSLPAIPASPDLMDYQLFTRRMDALNLAVHYNQHNKDEDVLEVAELFYKFLTKMPKKKS